MSSTILMRGIPFDAQETYNSHTGETEYDRVAYSADVADWFDTMFSTGIVIPGGGTFTTELKVESQSGMHVKINPGRAVINGRLGYIEEAQVLDLDDPSTSNRIDRIVVELNLTERNFYVKVLKGTPSSSPVAVAPTKTDTIYQLVLADVLVTANVSGTANITDQRNNSELCGISNVRVGVYIPPSDSSENIGVSGDASEEFGGATNVQDALNNIYRVGDIKATMRKDLSDKWLECNGDVVTKIDYPDLADVDGLTAYISTKSFSYSGTLPSDIELESNYWENGEFNSATFAGVYDVCKVGNNSYAAVAYFTLINSTERSAPGSVIFFISGISDISELPMDLNDWICVKQAFPRTNLSTARVNSLCWTNNTFILMVSAWVTEGTNVHNTANIGYAYYVTGSTLTANSDFLSHRISLSYYYNSGGNDMTNRSVEGCNYVSGRYNFYVTFSTRGTSSWGRSVLQATSLSNGLKLETTNRELTFDRNVSMLNNPIKILGGTYVYAYTSSQNPYLYLGVYGVGSILGVDNTSVSPFIVKGINLDNDNEVYCLCGYTKNNVVYAMLFKATSTSLQMLTSSGWTNANNTTPSFGSYRIGSSTPNNLLIHNGKLYLDWREFDNISDITKIPSGSNWDDNNISTLAYTVEKSRVTYLNEIVGEDMHGNKYSFGTTGFSNYDNAIKLPELTADDVSTYYVKVKG